VSTILIRSTVTVHTCVIRIATKI